MVSHTGYNSKKKSMNINLTTSCSYFLNIVFKVDCCDYCVIHHNVTDVDEYIKFFNLPFQNWMHLRGGIAETTLFRYSGSNHVLLVHKIAKVNMPNFKKISLAGYKQNLDTMLERTTGLILRPVYSEYGETVMRKNLNVRAHPEPLHAKFSIITECCVNDVDVAVMAFEGNKQEYKMAGIDEFFILKDIKDDNMITLVGSFSNPALIDRFKSHTNGKSDFAKMYTPLGVNFDKPCTTFITRNCKKYGWVGNKRRVSEVTYRQRKIYI